MRSKKLSASITRLCMIILFLFVSATINYTIAQADVAASQKSVTISGTIRDNLNSVLPGATITDLHTGKVVLTNESGFFSIEANKGDSLTASFVGYQTFRWQFTNTLTYNIILESIAGGLNEVVVVGYGKQKKISLVGAQSSVNIQELEQQPVANLSTMLAGRISGLVGVQRSGLPGSNSGDIWIRGINTFGSSASGPLIIIDGVQGRDLNNLDPNDIESFTILKDATSTAVYGAQGANGVILINTRRGSVQKVTLSARYYEGITAFTKMPRMANAQTYMELRNEAEVASGFSPSYSQNYIDSTLSKSANHYVYPNVDWLNSLFNRTSHNRHLNISSSGGNENTQFYTSLSYYEESSLLKTDGLQNYDAGTKFQRYNYVANVDMKWTKTTRFSLGIQGDIQDLNQPGAGATSAFGNAMSASPVRYPTMYPGNLVAGIAEGATPSPNPWASITQTGYIQNFEADMAATVRLDQKLDFWVKGLSVNGQYSYDATSTNEEDRIRQRSVYFLNQGSPYNSDGSLNLEQVITGSDVLNFASTSAQTRQFTMQGQLLYQRAFGDHNISGMVVYQQVSIPNPMATTYADAIPTREQTYSGRATYSYKSKYFAEFDAGYTGSQVFSPNNRYGFFPSVGVGWVLSNEDFWKPLSNIFQFFKLRYSNGSTGAIGGPRFDYITTITNTAKGITFGTSSQSHGYSGINVSHYGADVRWAKSHDQDIGLEFKVFNNKLSFVGDWFRKYRTGIFLTRANFPGFAGLQYNPDGNYGITIGKGFDATVDLSPVSITDKLSFSLRGTITMAKTKLLENGAAPYAEPYMDPRGQSILTNYGYIADGLFQNQAEVDNHADQSGVGGKPRPGDIMYKDLNGDGVINSFDETYIGHGDVAPWTYGVSFTVNYSNFYTSVFFEGVQGADREITGNARSPFAGSDDNNIYAIATDRWTEDNLATNPFYPRLGFGVSANANNNVTSTWWIKDISFLRLKTIDIGYNIPDWVFKRAGIKNAQIFFEGFNVLYWSPFKLWDPEMNTGNGNTYPNTRTFSIGLQVNFK